MVSRRERRSNVVAPGDLAVLVDVVSNFVRDEVIPVDDLHDGDVDAAGGESLRSELQSRAPTRALLLEACRELDAGGRGSHITSITKTFAAEALHRVVDRSVQMCGGLGVSNQLPVAKLAREIRPFRIYDGPSEEHRWSICKASGPRSRCRGCR
jgi:hypothetical protein